MNLEPAPVRASLLEMLKTKWRGPAIRLAAGLLGLAYWAGLLAAFLAVVVAIRLWPYLVEPHRLPHRMRHYFSLWCGVSATVVVLGGWVALLRHGKKRFIFSHVLFAFVVGSSALIGWLALSAVVPPWPNRDLRAQPLDKTSSEYRAEEYNKWDQRDLQRELKKPQGAYRILFVGDSFLEGGFCKTPIPQRSELLYRERLKDQSVECVNLGVCGTDPPHYYYRMKKVGAKLQPDAVFLFFFAGNDFIQPAEAFQPGKQRLTKYVADVPFPSVLGEISPQLNWLVMNRFRPGPSGSETQPEKPTPPTNEFELFKEMCRLPYEEGTQKIAEHVHRYHTPQYTPDQIVAVLRRGGPAFWAEFKQREKDTEYLQGWLVANMMSWELGIPQFPRSVSDVGAHSIDATVAATVTWIDGIKAQCDELGVPLVVFLAPVGSVDPVFVEFWKPWPSYFSFNYYQTARATAFATTLRAKGIQLVDLTDVLAGVPNTYRKTDAHWNEKGHDVVADIVVREIARLRGAR